MNVNDFYNQVSRYTDTEGSEINVAETKRVLAIAFQLLSQMPTAESADLISKGLKLGSKKKPLKAMTTAPKKKKVAKRKTAKRKTSKKK